MAVFHTHEVLNQTPPLGDVDLWADDLALQGAVRAFGKPSNETEASLADFGQRWGSFEMLEWGRLANENPPKLKTYDPKGYRADIVEFHPAYHALMRESIAAGIHASVWDADGKVVPGEFVARTARQYMTAEVEQGHGCPITMTHAAIGALLAEPALVSEWLPGIRSRQYDPRFLPAGEKQGVTIGMGMTEKQGGSDVRANTTRAEPDANGAYRIIGHKWFFSAPMCDAFLVLAQAKAGLTCFLMPRFLPDGGVNEIRLRRLKDKLGNRSNASSEVEFEGAYARRCGAEGEGIKTIINMVQLTRLDCVTGSLGIMRSALMQAIHHARHRIAFQRKLVDQPLMRAVLADLALEREAMIALGIRLAAAFERAAHDPDEAALARLVTPAAKLYVCKAAPGFVYEALECLGGNGYVEEGPLARLYREAPLNAIWEGSGNIMGLDVLRSAGREPESTARVLAKFAKETDGLPGAREAIARIERGFAEPEREALARRTGELLSLVAAAAALATSAPAAVAEAFAARRLSGLAGRNYGEPFGIELADQLLNRAMARAA